MVNEAAPLKRPSGNVRSVASPRTIVTDLLLAYRCVNIAARSSSISTAVKVGTDAPRTSVVAPYPGPTSKTSSPRSTSPSAQGRMVSRTNARHSSLPHCLWFSFTFPLLRGRPRGARRRAPATWRLGPPPVPATESHHETPTERLVPPRTATTADSTPSGVVVNWTTALRPFRTMWAFFDGTGTTTVPCVPPGAFTLRSNSPLVRRSQPTWIGPRGVGACPSAQRSVPGWGATVQVAKPAVAGWIPNTYAERSGVGPLAHPWARLVKPPSAGRPSSATTSQKVLVASGPGESMAPQSWSMSARAPVVSPAANRACTSRLAANGLMSGL